ncbi:MAG: VOC family protein [Cyanobacteria bacterium J06614_10]
MSDAIESTTATSRATPYLSCRDARSALDWYAKVFGATELIRLADDTGKVMHAEIQIGDAAVMLADEFPQMGYVSPLALGGSTVSIYVRVDSVDNVFAAALENGAIEVMAVSDHFDGDRRGTLKDPFGHIWLVATRIEDVSLAEVETRFKKMMEG